MPDLLLCTAVPPGLQAAHARLLTGAGLRLEEAGECTALLLADDGALLACGTRSGKVLRQIAVSPEAEGGGACAEVVSALLQDATAHGVPHPFLFTAPGKSGLFRSLGFTPLAQTADMLMMEHGRGGLRRFLSGIPVRPERPVGSIVCHANPFTLGHRHLIAYAAARCAQVLVFVLSDTDSLFPPELRLRLVREGSAECPGLSRRRLSHQPRDVPGLFSQGSGPRAGGKMRSRPDAVRQRDRARAPYHGALCRSGADVRRHGAV